MAGFQTHISVSTAVGVAYGYWIHSQFSLPPTTAAVAGGLCAIAGMLPDLDSDSGIPARETISFTAAVIPMVLMQRFRRFGLNLEQMILAGTPVYIFIRFGLGTLLKEFTVHRGMFHSIPAMLLAGMLMFLMSDSSSLTLRTLNGIAVSLGYLSHLILDEIWSVEVSLTGSRLKSSSGTALKFFGGSAAANATCWGFMLLAGFGILQQTGVSVSEISAPQYATPARPPQTPMADPREFSPPMMDEFEPLPDFPPLRQPARAVSEQGRITPQKVRTQAQGDRWNSYER